MLWLDVLRVNLLFAEGGKAAVKVNKILLSSIWEFLSVELTDVYMNEFYCPLCTCLLFVNIC